jgi:hypothetical protein
MARDNYQKGTGKGHRPERRISVRGVRREQPDLRKLAQALIALAQAQAEADAKAAHELPRTGGGQRAADQGRDTITPKEAA